MVMRCYRDRSYLRAWRVIKLKSPDKDLLGQCLKGERASERASEPAMYNYQVNPTGREWKFEFEIASRVRLKLPGSYFTNIHARVGSHEYSSRSYAARAHFRSRKFICLILIGSFEHFVWIIYRSCANEMKDRVISGENKLHIIRCNSVARAKKNNIRLEKLFEIKATLIVACGSFNSAHFLERITRYCCLDPRVNLKNRRQWRVDFHKNNFSAPSYSRR